MKKSLAAMMLVLTVVVFMTGVCSAVDYGGIRPMHSSRTITTSVDYGGIRPY